MYGSRETAINFRNRRRPLNSPVMLRKIGVYVVFTLVLARSLMSSAFAQSTGPTSITLDEAIQMALQHNHNMLAARTTIQQSEAEETTANLRPNPVLSGDAQFLPIFQPDKFSEDYINTTAQFDVGIGYLFERGRKRQHRLQ